MPSIHGRVGFAAYKSICKNVITVTASRRQSLILFNYHKCYPIAENSSVLRPHSIIIASCKPGCKPGFTRFAARFSTNSCGFATCFRHAFDTLSTRFRLFFLENLVADLLHQSRHVEIDAAGLLVRARARQMECRKNPFRASQRTY